ncbi:MAG: YraN family protein [Eubacteriales bacterium]
METNKQRTGRFGEDAAVSFLRKNGYRILRRNFKALGHEIDIIAENKDVLAFIEVKTRRTDPAGPMPFGRPAAAVSTEQQRHIILAARCYLAAHPTSKPCRLDIIEVYADPQAPPLIKHMCGAFHA